MDVAVNSVSFSNFRVIYDNSVNNGTSVITLKVPLHFRVITLVRKLNLFPHTYVGSEIQKSGFMRKKE